MKQLVSRWNLMKHFLWSTITLLKERAFPRNLLQLAISQFQSNLLQLSVPKESDETTCNAPTESDETICNIPMESDEAIDTQC
ncbi:hypothetical protein TNCV_339821 [Trichonephila clavipes]|nr:hypothetical protein TNCV_339821 [Trichonephila clavipes]